MTLSSMSLCFSADTSLASESDAPLRILLADDYDPIRSLAARILRREGWEVVAVCDGQAAVEVDLAAPQPFDIVIFDLEMPRLNGYDAYERLRARHPDLPCLFMSGGSNADLDQRVRSSALPFLPKPFGIQRLVEWVRRLTPSTAHHTAH
jgi:two-component system, cell cycle sensor histidine kinase and response regulator CckA